MGMGYGMVVGLAYLVGCTLIFVWFGESWSVRQRLELSLAELTERGESYACDLCSFLILNDSNLNLSYEYEMP